MDFSRDHSNPKDSQVLLALTGTPEFIRRKLLELIDEIHEVDKPCRKPRQGISVEFDGVCEVITPIWNGKPY